MYTNQLHMQTLLQDLFLDSCCQNDVFNSSLTAEVLPKSQI